MTVSILIPSTHLRHDTAHCQIHTAYQCHTYIHLVVSHGSLCVAHTCAMTQPTATYIQHPSVMYIYISLCHIEFCVWHIQVSLCHILHFFVSYITSLCVCHIQVSLCHITFLCIIYHVFLCHIQVSLCHVTSLCVTHYISLCHIQVSFCHR